MKFNNIHLKNQEKNHLELVLNYINTTQTIFKNRVNFIALSENQEIILEVVKSVEEILDYNIFKLDLIYSLIYKEIKNICIKIGKTEWVYWMLIETINSVYSGKLDCKNNNLNYIFYYFLYLKNIWVKKLELIEFIDSLNINENLDIKWEWYDYFGFEKTRGDDFYNKNEEELEEEKNQKKEEEMYHSNSDDIKDLYKYMKNSRNIENEIKYWNEFIKILEKINEKYFKKSSKKELIRECNKIKNNLENWKIREAERYKDKVFKQIISDSRIIEKEFEQREREKAFNRSL